MVRILSLLLFAFKSLTFTHIFLLSFLISILLFFQRNSHRLLGTGGAVAQTGWTAPNVQRVPRDHGPRPPLGGRGNARASENRHGRSQEKTGGKFQAKHEERAREAGEERRESKREAGEKTTGEFEASRGGFARRVLIFLAHLAREREKEREMRLVPFSNKDDAL